MLAEVEPDPPFVLVVGVVLAPADPEPLEVAVEWAPKVVGRLAPVGRIEVSAGGRLLGGAMVPASDLSWAMAPAARARARTVLISFMM